MQVTDDKGRELELPDNIERIVSLVPTISELIYDLNAEEKLYGVTSSCVHPKYFQKEKNIVGSPQEVHINKILELKPDIIFASFDDNTEEDLAELSKKFNVFVCDVRSIDDAKASIAKIGEILNRRNEASKINLKIDMQLKDLERITSSGLLYRTAAYFIWGDPLVAAGRDTFINSMLELVKVKNVFTDLKERYPAITAANIHLANPDVILLPDQPYEFNDEDAITIGRSTHEAATFFVDGTAFSWFGSRLIKSIDYLKLLAVKFQDMK